VVGGCGLSQARADEARLQAQPQAARFALHALILDGHGAPARVKLQRLLAQLVAVALALHRVPQQLAVVALQLADLHSIVAQAPSSGTRNTHQQDHRRTIAVRAEQNISASLSWGNFSDVFDER